MSFAEVAIATGAGTFTYVLPPEYNISAGWRVSVPLLNRAVTGFIVSVSDKCDIAPEKLKRINKPLDDFPAFTEETLAIAKWMSEYYYTSLASCLKCAAPYFGAAAARGKKAKVAFVNEDAIPPAKLPVKSQEVFDFVADSGRAYVADIKNCLNVSASVIDTLVKRRLLVIEEEEVLRSVLPKAEEAEKPDLTACQKDALAKTRGFLEKDLPVLICGVTGSGKTEIYMRLIEDTIEAGKQAIMLVPEISLTPQTAAVFSARFGEKVTITHSRLSAGERFDQWKKAMDGKVSVVIGPRSAVFMPFSRLGLIVIDEEHEKTYKSEYSPKYDVLGVAEKRAELSGAKLVLGSATPSVSSYYRAVEKREFELVIMSERVNKTPPEMVLVDMRRELAQGNRSIFSNELFNALTDNLERGKQSILFLNRRGHSTFVSCRQCGHVMACNNCSVNYTYHSFNNSLICHYCGGMERVPQNCPVCGSKYIKFFGAGTQRIEQEIEGAFPSAKIARMDFDTTAEKRGHEKIIEAFAKGGGDILVGTQMLAKGLNFPLVSVVGVLAADSAIHSGDYASAETAYQLITQVAGRAGRGEFPGTVYVQTYMPEHYSIKFSSESKYERFYEHEIAIRRQMEYPPFSHIFMALFTGENERAVISSLHKLCDIMKAYNRKGFFTVLGPSPAFVAKVRKCYRWKLLIKGKDAELLKKFVFYCMDKLDKGAGLGGVSVNLTLDPSVIL
ncbi:primosomal protein N' [Clostridia bacterium]|nr:primosomal protein N' [Clostridia bacterium]